MAEEFDVLVIGSGPGGYVNAIRAAQLGLKTGIIEKRKTLGGTCLNVGCIPSKALLDSSEEYHKVLHKTQDHGIGVGKVTLDLNKLMERKNVIVKEVTDGVDYLMKKNKITRYEGFGKLLGGGKVEVSLADGKKETLSAKHIVLATGSVPIDIPSLPVDGKTIITSDHAIDLRVIPKKLVIIGAGVIGLELGSVWQRLGAQVTVVELLPGLLTNVDKSFGNLLQRSLEGQGFNFLFEHKVLGASSSKNGVKVKIAAPGGKESELDADVVLVAIGRRPFIEGIGLEDAGVQLTERKRIKVDSHFRTNIPGIYAIGDVIDGPMLAHKAEEEGVALAELIAGQSGHVNYLAVPSIMYTWPELAWVGKGEEELKAAGVEYKTGKSLFKPNARAKAMNEAEGQVKILADKKTDKILGAFVFGPRASDMIAELAVAVEFGASAEDIARSFHAHPTLSEVVKEAAMAVDKWAIHA
ncbi:dihydrolipoyl dehydrogenase [Leptospira broomii serovar Hurstbridge str. 5399]|uniref:Dihydrolipoyl dehydrogenase n=1 Tax=Leptospira broomii serovar Hurstbridge str. 5399 TaxID=1049789 RepID=T0GEZ2_9LEPT|nr:dihydrolipoyl dehydrogenase [Leptospira broomii]EQA43973.1 dihydrolipoyl dehydrogenase [Leptospira broomii serovar Hurstbridge str. 5399]